MEPTSIGVIGGGIAGNAIALFLARKGFQVTLLEKHANPKPVGSGIMLQPPAIKNLERLGLKENILNNGCHIDGFLGIKKSGKTVLDFDFKSVNQDLYGVGVHRGSIFSNLYYSVSKEKNISLECNWEVVNIEDQKSKVVVTNKKGNSLDFAFIIVANGSRSTLRELFPKIIIRSKPQSYAALWTTLPYTGEKYLRKISHVYHKSQHMYGLMPIGHATNEHINDPMINFFCAITKEELDSWGLEKFNTWKERSYKIAHNYSEFIDKIEDFNQLTATPYYDTKLKPFFHKKIVFIGDACHALSPHLSAGTNLALMDAFELSQSIVNSPTTTEAFTSYYHSRKNQVYYYYFISKLITPLFQSEINYSLIRDYVIPLLYKVPVTKKMMVETIAGIKTGFFSSLPKKYYV